MNKPGSREETIRAEVTEAVAKFMEVFNSGDLDRIVELYTTDCVVVPPGRPPVVGREALKAFWDNMLNQVGMTDISHEIVKIEVFNDRYAAEITTFNGIIGGKPHSGGYLVNWRKEEDRWKLHHDVFNAVERSVVDSG